MAAIDSRSSCVPHPTAQSGPPIAHAPNPTRVICISVRPRRRVGSVLFDEFLAIGSPHIFDMQGGERLFIIQIEYSDPIKLSDRSIYGTDAVDIRQLQHFVAVAEEKHFTRAARRMNIVQSALSNSIRLLEEELDAKLFVRSTRQVRLTDAGQILLDKAKAALESIRDAREAVAAVRNLERGTLSIGTVQSLPAFLDLPSLVERFHAEYPGVELRLRQGSATDLIEKIRNGLSLSETQSCWQLISNRAMLLPYERGL